MNAHFDHLPEPLAVDHRAVSPICSNVQDLQRAFPATILIYGLILMNWSIRSFPVSKHRLLRLHWTQNFQNKKEPNIKPVLLGHYLEALNNLEPNNVLNSLECIFFSSYGHICTTLCKKSKFIYIVRSVQISWMSDTSCYSLQAINHPKMCLFCPLSMLSGWDNRTTEVFLKHTDQSSVIQHTGPRYRTVFQEE